MKEFAATQRKSLRAGPYSPIDIPVPSRCREGQPAKKTKLTELAQEQPRYGYRRLEVLLRREGEVVNHMV